MPAAPVPPSPARLSWRLWLVLLLLGASYPWAQWHGDASRLTREPNGYYGELTEAFLAGQLHLKAQPDPRLETLANPYNGEQGVPRLHDHVYFNRRYYLYFGTPPVFLVFAPFKLVTGYYLPDGMGTAVFGLLGFACGAWLLLRLKARLFPGLSEGWTIAGLTVWNFATHAQLISFSDTVYPVPINCAFLCLMAALACCDLAWERLPRRRWLVLAGVAWGLAIASRPNYLFSLGGYVVFLLGLLLRNRSLPPAERASPVRLLTAGILPVFLIGCALAAYNWVRFHSLTEFGTSYMMIAGDPRKLPVLSLANVPGGLYNTLFNPVHYTTYFPFALPLAKGTVVSSPLLLLILLLPWLWFRARPAERTFWRVGGTTLLLAAAGNHLTICMSQTQEYRYNVDYLPAAVLLSVLICWSLAHAFTGATTRLARAGRLALGFALLFTLGHALAGDAAMFNLPLRTPTLNRWLNYPTHWIETAVGYRYGTLRLEGRLPALPPGSLVPLVVTGRGNDILYLRYTGPNEVKFGFFHAGAGGAEGGAFPLDLARPHRFDVELGSLYPPTEHPLYANRPPREVKLLRQRVRVTVDDQVALETASDFYPTHPGDLLLGRNPNGILTGNARLDLSGLTVTRLGLPTQALVASYPLKPVRLEVSFPPFVHYKREPLISTGRRGAGDLLYVIYVAPNQLRLAHDSWGGSSVESWIINYEPGRVYSLEVDMGSLHPRPAGESGVARLQIQLDDQLILVATRPYHASDATELAFGYNANESTASYPLFTGQIRKITSLDQTSTAKRAAETAAKREYGTLRCAVQFPTDRTGVQEPLVVTGRTGKGDFIYVVYSGNNTIRLGYDHWGKGGPVSAPIPVDYQQTQLLEITMGSLLPPLDDDAAWKNLDPAARRQLAETVTIKLNGKVVLTAPASPYPATGEGEVTVGTNTIGGSTCEPLFSGRFLLSEWIMPAPPAAGTP